MITNITVQDIYIYPIKSLGGIRVEKAVLEARGLQYDRRWMLVDENNRFLSQRELAQLALFKLEQLANGFKVSAPFNESAEFEFPFQLSNGNQVQVSVWDDQCNAIEYHEGSKWFSEQINKKCKLVYMPANSIRYVEKEYAHNNEIVSFSDGYPLLLIGQPSLDELNSKLLQPIEMKRFRPNLVTSGSKPFEEDNWKTIKINTIEIQVAKPCARCVIPSINPHTATVEKEPLATLSLFRKRENSIYFGQNLLHQNTGCISCGDEVIVNEF